MLKLNDSAGDRHGIGRRVNSNQLVYVSLIKHIKEEEKAGTIP